MTSGAQFASLPLVKPVVWFACAVINWRSRSVATGTRIRKRPNKLIFLLVFCFYFSAVFVRPYPLLSIVEICPRQVKRVPLDLRTWNFSTSYGILGLSCGRSAWFIHQPLIHHLCHPYKELGTPFHTGRVLKDTLRPGRVSHWKRIVA